MKSPRLLVGAGALAIMLVAGTLAALLTGVPGYLDLAQNVAQADGVVVQTIHGTLFSYTADGIRYTGHYQAMGQPSPPSGQPLTVYYHAERPVVSSNYHPINMLLLWRAQAVLVAGSFALMLFLALGLPWGSATAYFNASSELETPLTSHATSAEFLLSLPYTITYKNQSIGWHTGFLGLWLAGWTGLCILLIRAVVLALSIESLLLLLPFILAELLGIALLLWLVRGRRELTLTDDLLIIRYQLFGRQFVRQVPRSSIRQIWQHDNSGIQLYNGVEIATTRGIVTLGWLEPEQCPKLAALIESWAGTPGEIITATSTSKHWNAV